MGWWLLRLSAKILALLRLSVNFFQKRLTKKLNINKSGFFAIFKAKKNVLKSSRDEISYSFENFLVFGRPCF